jgi:hypothetical protein
MRKLKFRAGVLTRKYADRQGKIDGRMNFPNENDGEGGIPFLVDLSHETLKKIENIELQKMQDEEKSESREVKVKASLKSKELESELVVSLLKGASQDLNDALQLEKVEESELGDARSVKFRTISTPLYLLLLFFMGVGEFAVTRAAFGYLFNEDPQTAVAMTIATVAVSIGFAHLAGIAWKRSHDKANYPNDGVLRFWRYVGLFVLIFVLVLGAARAANLKVPGELTKVSLRNVVLIQPGYVFTFFILQFVLILVAMGASYSHYSLPLERIHMYMGRSKKNHKKQAKNLKQLRTLEFKLKKEVESRPQIERRAKNKVRATIHEYYSIAQAYKAGNLRGRAKTVNPNLKAFTPPKLNVPDWYNE